MPRGYVSDETNNYFSSCELRALRNSFLAVNRNNNGPGRRGILSIKNACNPVIQLFNADESENPEDEKDNRLSQLFYRGRLSRFMEKNSETSKLLCYY